MSTEERIVLEQLDKLVQESDLSFEIRRSKELLQHDASLLAGTVPVSLNKFTGYLPAEIGSARIFTLRANTQFRTERHPNSRQRVVSLEGTGQIMVKDKASPRILTLVSSPDTHIEERWASVTANVWHQPQANAQDWVVLTFHQVPEHELIDEYLD